MTPEDRDLISSQVVVPGRPRPGDPARILRHFGVTDGAALGLDLLRDAVARRDDADVEMAMIVSALFGVTPDYLDVLVPLVAADWHRAHEDVVSALDRLRDPAAVEALVHATRWIPEYLDYDESRALAVKAIWALSKMPGSEAREALIELRDTSDDEIVRAEASERLRT